MVETGWPKLDPLFRDDAGESARLRAPAAGREVVMFASTFTERLSAAPQLFDAIAAEVARGDRYWLLTLHPKCAPALVERYRALAGPNAAFVETEQLVAAQRAADVLLADTTSVVSEFAVQRKPVVTFRNRAPKPHMLDFDEAEQLPAMLARAFAPDARAAGRAGQLRRCDPPVPRRALVRTGDRRDRGAAAVANWARCNASRWPRSFAPCRSAASSVTGDPDAGAHGASRTAASTSGSAHQRQPTSRQRARQHRIQRLRVGLGQEADPQWRRQRARAGGVEPQRGSAAAAVDRRTREL